MEKITRSSFAVKAVCIILAAALWFYVSYEENPSMSKTVRNVPLSIAGEQALKENGFAVYKISDTSVDVKVTARRLSLRKITNKTLAASINVSSIKDSGDYVIPATVSSAESSSASFYVKGRDITVSIEPIETKSYKIDADIAEGTNSDLIIKSYSLSSKKVTITAPKSIISEISAVKTEMIVPESRDVTEQTEVRLIVLGHNGKPLEGAECMPSSVDIKYSFYDVKTVPVYLRTSDGALHELVPERTVKIYGNGDVFNETTFIKTEEINLSSYSPGNKFKAKLAPPDGVEIASDIKDIEIELK